jgi:hypothetical protein
MEQKTKRCPYCGEEILAVAKKCKHCGEWLEPKEITKEQKPCPICGEQVDVDASVCPHCKEPIVSEIEEEVSNKQVQEQPSQNSDFCYCKTCGAKLNIKVGKCPQCGDNDPLLFSHVTSYNKLTNWWVVALFFCVLIGIPLLFSVFSIEYSVFAILIWVAGFWWLLTSSKKSSNLAVGKDLETMYKVCNEVGDPDGFRRWVKQIEEKKDVFTKLFSFYKIGD